MSRLAYVNGRFLRQAEAGVSIEDRGYQLGDGIYEVWAVIGGRLADPEGHFARLERSLGELQIPMPMSRAALTVALRETVRRNRVRHGIVYLQVTRGVARRDHAFPSPAVSPSVVITARSTSAAAAEARADKGVGVITTPENRWGRCDIKTVDLLPNVLAKQAAKEQGAFEAWFVDAQGLVTEGASSNAWIVDQDGVLRTRDTGANILRGVTRLSLLDVAARGRIPRRGAALHRPGGQVGARSLPHRRRGAGHADREHRRSGGGQWPSGGGGAGPQGRLYPPGRRDRHLKPIR